MSSEIQNRSVQKDFSLDSLTLKHKSYYDENYQGTLIRTTANGGAITLKNIDSGKVFQVTQAVGALTITLPVAQPGLKFTFVLTTASGDATHDVIIADPNANIYGVLIDDIVAVLPANSATSLTFNGNLAAVGDTMVFEGVAKGVYKVKAITSVNNGGLGGAITIQA